MRLFTKGPHTRSPIAPLAVEEHTTALFSWVTRLASMADWFLQANCVAIWPATTDVMVLATAQRTGGDGFVLDEVHPATKTIDSAIKNIFIKFSFWFSLLNYCTVKSPRGKPDPCCNEVRLSTSVFKHEANGLPKAAQYAMRPATCGVAIEVPDIV